MSLRETKPVLDFGRGVTISSNGRQFVYQYGTKGKRYHNDLSSALKSLLQDSVTAKMMERAGKVEEFLKALKEAEREIDQVLARSAGNSDQGPAAEAVRAEPAPVNDHVEPGASTPSA